MSHDSKLQKAVLAELRWEPSVDAAHIGVAADGDVVTLAGHVRSYAERQAAEAAAYRVKGVKAVVQQIDVRLPSDIARTDEEIAEAAVNRLAWDTFVPSKAIRIEVRHGWVTLDGEVDSQFQRKAAEDDVGRLYGVIGVVNNIAIKPVVKAGEISDNIMHALHRSWFFDPQTIKVTAQGGKVTLSGTADSVHDRKLAAATAWVAPGVTEVDNRIIVV